MSQPICTNPEQPKLNGTILEVGHGDWRASGDLGELANPKWLPVIGVGSSLAWGKSPQMPSVPQDVTYPGELDYNARLALDLWAYQTEEPEPVRVNVYVAQFFKGWGDHPANAWEWGHYINATDPPRPVEFDLMLPAKSSVPPPPPVSSPLPPELKTMVDNVNAEIAKEKAHDAINLINANKLAFSKLTLQLAKQALGQSPEPLAFPETAHALRAASGLLQESAIAHRLAKP